MFMKQEVKSPKSKGDVRVTAATKGGKSAINSDKKVMVRQIRSLIGRDPRVRQTMRALGLGRIGSEHEHVLSTSVVGMIRRVEHLVTLHEVH